jgi:hypothetical protein
MFKGATAFKNIKKKILKKAKGLGVDPPPKGFLIRNGTKVKKFWLKATALRALNESLTSKNISGIEEAILMCQSLEDYDFDIKNKTKKNAQIILGAMEQIEAIKAEQDKAEQEKLLVESVDISNVNSDEAVT